MTSRSIAAFRGRRFHPCEVVTPSRENWLNVRFLRAWKALLLGAHLFFLLLFRAYFVHSPRLEARSRLSSREKYRAGQCSVQCVAQGPPVTYTTERVPRMPVLLSAWRRAAQSSRSAVSRTRSYLRIPCLAPYQCLVRTGKLELFDFVLPHKLFPRSLSHNDLAIEASSG